MKKMTFEEIIAAFRSAEIEVSEFAYDDIVVTDDLNIPNWKEMSQHGGEGKGDDWWSVKYFPDHDIYMKVEGWYQSYQGTEFRDWNHAVTEVKPQEKTITVYE